MINVFISHNYKDKPMARKIAKELNKYGIKPWIDESEIKLGDSLIEKIRDGLDHMDYLIALISGNSVESEWVKKELDIAMNSEIEGKRVITIPILVGKCVLPGFLKGKLYADMSTPRKYNENISTLIRRFDINEIEDDKNEFTEFKLNAVQVIERLENIKNENEIIEFLESFGYSERSLFYRDTFILTVNKLLADRETSLDILVSLIEICEYCPDDAIIKLNFTQLLNRVEEQVLQSTISVLKGKKNLKIQQKKIIKILRECKSTELEKCIWDYFLNTQIDIEVAEALWNYIEEKLENGYSNYMVLCMGKLYNQLNDDRILEKWYSIWEYENENKKRNLVNNLCQYGFQAEGVYIVSPKLRNNIRNVLFNSFGEKDTDNANLMISMLTGAGNLVENRKEIWDKLVDLDEYSILLTLEILRDEYNIAYIFDSVEDIDGIKNFISFENKNIKKAALEVIAEINLKEALDIINSEEEFVLQGYYATSVLYTIVKETDIKEYKKLFEKVKEKIETGYYNQRDKNLICFGDYVLGNLKLDDMVNKIEISQEQNGGVYEISRKNKLLAEKLATLIKNNDSCAKKIQELIKKAESVYRKY